MTENIDIDFKNNPETTGQSQKMFTEEEYNILNNKYLTALADLDNFRKRVQREQANIINNANKDLIIDFLDVIDDMERLLENSDNEGFKLIYNKFLKILENEGCEKIETKIGDKFNVSIHEAIIAKPGKSEEQSESIFQIFQNGYMLNNNLIRPCKVGVYSV